MKDSYWVLLGGFAFIAVSAWIGVILGNRKAKKRIEEQRLHGYQPYRRSIWTKDLLDNRFGNIFRGYILPVFFVANGIFAVLTRQARWSGFDYHGFDAICIGVGVICLGLIFFMSWGWKPRNAIEAKIQNTTFLLCWISLVGCFSTALFRNI